MVGMQMGPAASGGPEVEIKLEAEMSDDGLRRVLALRPAAAKLAVSQLRSVYFDTDDLKLRENGVSLRVRWDGRRHTQTLKVNPRAGLPTRRLEIKREIESEFPHLTATEKRVLREAGLNPKKAVLKEAFEVEVRRSRWRQGGVEIAVDEGKITADARQVQFLEVEIEDKGCGARELFRQAARLRTTAELAVMTLTKAERGYGLASGEWEQPASWRTPVLSPRMSAAEGFRAIAESCVQHFMLNERALRSGFDSRGVHQARLAIRRLRATLSFFAPLARDARVGRVKADLKWLSAQLGAVRDLDVFYRKFLSTQLRRNALAEGVEIRAHFDRWRSTAFDTLASSLRSERFRQAMLGLIEWLECGDWRALSAIEAGPGAESFASFIDKRMRRSLKRLSRGAKDLPQLDDAAIHTLRRKAKNLRYVAESHRAVLENDKDLERHGGELAALRSIQSQLGRRQDLIVAQTLLRSLLDAQPDGTSPGGPDMYFAGGVLAQVAASEPTDHLILEAQKAFQRLAR
jgi:inorganic triphosphatase YgiF